LQNLDEGGNGRLVGGINGLKDEDHVSFRPGSEPITLLHQHGVDGVYGDVTQEPMAEPDLKPLSGQQCLP
jgi:hypothetical protein